MQHQHPTYELLLVNNSKYMLICSILQDIATQNMHDLEFDLSRSLKVEVNGVIRKPTIDFLLVNNYNYMYVYAYVHWFLSYKCLKFFPP